MDKNIRKNTENNAFIKATNKLPPLPPKFREDLPMFRKITLLLSGLFLMLASGLFTACQCESPTQPPGNSTPSITNQTFAIAEDATNGTIIGTVNASDDNAVTNYAITNGNIGNAFAISSNGQLTLITNLNYDTTSNYSLAIQVIDSQGSSDSAIITVNVTDVDYPPMITNQTFTVAEDATNGTIIGTVNASDDNAVTNYAITNGNIGNAFAISSNGQLTLITNLNYDTTSNYSLAIQVIDSQGSSDSAIITVNVTDVDYPPMIANQTFTIAEDATNGTIIGTVNATDDNAVTNYTITSGNIGNVFAISSSGQLSLITNLNYGTTSNYNLNVEVTDSQGATKDAIITVNVIDVLEWQTRYITNTVTNFDVVNSTLTALNQNTIIDGLKAKIFAWLDVSISPLLITNGSGRLTNWLDKKIYVIIGTNATTSPPLSITTNTNSQIEIISNERVAFTNIVTSTNITLSLILTNAISATPKSDVSSNNSLSFQAGNNGYIDVDYEGSDRVGFAIDTTPMGSSDNITAFYLVTEWIQGNNSWHVPLGYNGLAEGNRFLSKGNGNANYEPGGTRGVGNIVLGDSTFERNANFPIPSGVHLLSRRGLSISKSSLNGILGSFPTTTLGGNQRIREIIIFTNTLSDAEHSNIIKYFHDKWSIPVQGITTNISSYYSANGSNFLQNAVDGDISTFFQGQNSGQNSFTSNRILFEYRVYPSVLDGGASAVRGLFAGDNSLYLRTGHSVNNDALRASFRVEILRTNDDAWFVLSNVPADNTGRDKQFVFPLENASNDFLGYRVVANGSVSSPNWFTIDEFTPSSLSSGAPLVMVFSNTVANNKIYQTNEDLFLIDGFANFLNFDQAVYGLTTNDFVIENGTVLSINAQSTSNYIIVVRLFPFYGGSNTNTNTVIQSSNFRLSLTEGAVTNASGNESPPALLLLDFVPRNPFAGFDVGSFSTPTFVDLDGDGDLDLVSGEGTGTFNFYSNDGSNNFTEQTGGNNPLNGFDVGNFSTPTFVDLDGDGDLDLVSGEQTGNFNFYSNDGSNNFTEQTGGNNPLNGFDVGANSAPTFTDLDGDGDLDLVSGEGTGIFNFYRNDGSNFIEVTGGSNPLNGFDVGNDSPPSLVDLDGDGDLDLVGGDGAGTFNFYRNDGSNFTEVTGNNNPLNGFDIGGWSAPSLVDLDGDGDPDLVSGEQDGNFNFHMNISGQFVRGE